MSASWLSYFKLVMMAFGFSSLMACVGPTTPFGALESGAIQKSEATTEPRKVAKQSSLQIQFHPKKQVLHDKTDFSVEVISRRPLGRNTKVTVLHNGIDVTKGFLENAHVHKSADQRKWIFMVEDLRLKTLDPNQIEVKVLDPLTNKLARKQFSAPECSLFDKNSLAHLGPFHAPESYIELIEKVAGEFDSNPSFLAGVVAQESGFDPKAVSWAKAIGLTQMTPLAEEQVFDDVKDWPRYPGINTLSYLSLKSKVMRGVIDDEKEWRLDPQKSLKGGMSYFKYLQDYWNLEANRQVRQKLSGDENKNLTEIILASYNSGAARVKQALEQKNDQWKQHDSLREAVKYLRRVTSFCYHYGDHEVENDNET